LLARDTEEDYEGVDFAYSAKLYPAMTLGLAAQQDTGYALFRVRLGNSLSPIIKIPVLKSLAPEQTEMPPTELEEINARLDEIAQELEGDFVKVGFEDAEYQELTDLNTNDLLYVERNGIQSYISADGMLGAIERNVTTLTYETAVETTIADPTAYARTWFFPVEQLENNPINIENAEYELMNFQQNETPEVNMASFNVEYFENEEQEVGFSENEVQVASLGVEPENEQEPGFMESEVQTQSLGVEPDNEQEPGFTETEIQTQSLNIEQEEEFQPGESSDELNINPLGIGDPEV
jgi:hypothetical protein